jgi:hypothetical protein
MLFIRIDEVVFIVIVVAPPSFLCLGCFSGKRKNKRPLPPLLITATEPTSQDPEQRESQYRALLQYMQRNG